MRKLTLWQWAETLASPLRSRFWRDMATMALFGAVMVFPLTLLATILRGLAWVITAIAAVAS